MDKSLSVIGITDSDLSMSSIIGRANLLLTTSIGGGVQMRGGHKSLSIGTHNLLHSE